MTELQVIGAGFGRTGTASTKAALEMLGFGPCHHMFEVIQNEQHTSWDSIGLNPDEEKLKIILQNVLSGYKSSIDFPSSVFFNELFQMSPNAKVILTVRDSPEAWIKSVRDTIFIGKFGDVPIVGRFPFNYLIRWMPRFIIPGRRMNQEVYASRIWLGHDQKWNDEEVVKMYNRWIEHVTNTIPKEKLLIYNVKEGWEPLCRFLEVPIPNEPMPRSNDKTQFVERRKKRNRNQLIRCFLWYGGLIAGSYHLWKNTKLIIRSVHVISYA